MGLQSGTLWATCNVGASKSIESGYHFAWGEVAPKKDYSWQSYKWCVFETDSLTKYVCRDTMFKKERIGLDVYDLQSLLNPSEKRTECCYYYDELQTEDDAASVNWGCLWKTPTVTEVKELADECDWTFSKNYRDSGIAGYIGVSKVNGNTIFFPVTGEKTYDISIGSSRCCSYWSFSLDSDPGSHSTSAYILLLYDDYFDRYSLSRDVGLSVRAVVKR